MSKENSKADVSKAYGVLQGQRPGTETSKNSLTTGHLPPALGPAGDKGGSGGSTSQGNPGGSDDAKK